MNESTTITIDNIVKLIEGIAKAEYQRGYVAGLEEQRLTDLHWGKDKQKCHTCKHYTKGEYDGSCGSYICKEYSGWEDKTE
jgi:hypothetical protein